MVESKIRNRGYFGRKSMVYYIVLLGILVVLISTKKDLCIDEVFSYGLSNTQLEMVAEDGVKYEPAALPYLNYVSVSKTDRFNYDKVWENQAADTHPPFYYVILHTICSFFPETYSIWYGEVINIVAALLILLFVRKILRLLTDDNKLVECLTIGYIVSSGMLAQIPYIRMYVLANLLIIATTYYCLRIFQRANIRDELKLTLIIYLGAMTHYYCIIYSVFIVACLGVFLLIEHKWKQVGKILVISVVSGVASLVTFPTMITHLLGGKHGHEDIENLKNTDIEEIIRRVSFYLEDINYSIFGSTTWLFVILLVVCIVCIIIKRRGNEIKEPRKIDGRWVLLIVPSIAYFFFVAISSTYLMVRYVAPIFAVLYITCMYGMYCLMAKAFMKKIGFYIFVIYLAFITCTGWLIRDNRKWEYLCRHSTRELMTNVQEHTQDDCFVLYQDEIPSRNFYEVSSYKSVTFIPIEDTGMLTELIGGHEDGCVVCIPYDAEISQICELVNKPNVERLGERIIKTFYIY